MAPVAAAADGLAGVSPVLVAACPPELPAESLVTLEFWTSDAVCAGAALPAAPAGGVELDVEVGAPEVRADHSGGPPE